MYPAAGTITAPQAALLFIISVNWSKGKEQNAIFARFLLIFKKLGSGQAKTMFNWVVYNGSTSKKEVHQYV